jgi:putative ABC transport system permease protein
MTGSGPPRLALTLLRRFLPRDEREFVLGDLEELYRGRRARGVLSAHAWYWMQALRTGGAFASAPQPEPDIDTPMTRQGLWSALRDDLWYAFRTLRKAPGFALIAILTLAIGIGANTAIFSVVNAVVLRRLPFPEPDRLMRAYLLMPTGPPGAPRIDMFWSFPKYRTMRETQDIFEELALFNGRSVTLTTLDDAERLTGERVESTYFDVLRISPLVGRTLQREEDAPGADAAVVLSYDLWQRRYGGDSEAVGETIRLNGVATTIVGVMPPGFRGLTGAADFFVSFRDYSDGMRNNPGAHSSSVIGRLAPGVTVAQAKEAMATIGQRVDETYPSSMGPWSAHARTLEEVRVEPAIRTSVLLLFGAVGFVLLIACVNLANLLLGRAAAREREVAIRLAVGAGRGRVVRQLLTESWVLATVGGAAGLAVAIPTVGVLRRIAPRASGYFAEDISGLTRLGMESIGINGTALLFTIGITLVTGLLFGLVPALHTSRPNLTQALKEGGRGTSAGRGLRIGTREGLVVAEFALAFVLLVGSGLMIKSFGELQNTDMGFEPDNVLTLGLSLPSAEYDRETGHQFIRLLHERIAAVPGVEAVGYNICVPLGSGCNGTGLIPQDRPESDMNVEIHFITPDYFDALRIPVLRGRGFTEQDGAGAPGVVVVTESAAREIWPDGDPLGTQVIVGQGDQEYREVIGIVGDVRYNGVEERSVRAAYVPVYQSTRRSGFHVIRTSVDPATLIPTIREVVRSMDTALPLFDIKTMDERLGDATSSARFSALLLAIYSAVALLLAAIGIYGVLSYVVARRTHEIGLRMALGAEQGRILRLVVGRALAMALVGLAIGGVAAWAVTRVFVTILYQVQPHDAATFASVTGALVVLAFVASYLPARRASRVDPMVALRDL